MYKNSKINSSILYKCIKIVRLTHLYCIFMYKKSKIDSSILYKCIKRVRLTQLYCIYV